ncbi:hypothetical protein [uncultured Methanolobus sp.]|uniref:hypothetical protein n=1 Tax=uncultured Methanolobus sp. TaxID=218300 RepID=UPI0029C65F57|nr:hypothetical protein [uncultured Methanolobus sp.]
MIKDINNEFANMPRNYEKTIPSMEKDNIKKGDDFEEYVANLYPESDYTIVEWTTDTVRKHKRYVEADTRPDLLIRHKLSGEQFYVECKYRSYTIDNKIIWTNAEQLKRYQEFSKEKEEPVFIIIGLGGSPKRPESLFCIPLEDAKYTELYLNDINQFRRNREYFN